MVAVTTDASGKESCLGGFGVRAFLEQLSLATVAFAAHLGHLLDARWPRAVVAVTGDACGCAEIALFQKQVSVVTRLVFLHDVGRQLVLRHQLRVAVTSS